MRTFFVRPSDNGNYGIEAALATIQRPAGEVHRALFRGLRVPLEAVDFDPREGGLANLSRYGLVILAGLDPVVLSPGEQLALVAFVERGGALMLLGGSHSFGNAEGTYHLLDPILPVRVLRGLDVEANVMPSTAPHPIARGLPSPLGYVSKVHPVEPKPDAHVAMRAGERPLVVAGEPGYGRVVALASYPECDEAEYGWFFTGDAFDDFLRSAVAWLRKEQEPVWFESFSLPNRRVVTGNEEFGRVKLGAADAVAVQLATRLTNASGHVVHQSAATLQPKRGQESVFAFRVPDDPRARGLHYVAVVLSDASGREMARRDVAIEVINPTRVAVEFAHGRRVFLPGEGAQVRLLASSDVAPAPAEATVDVSLSDCEGRPLLAPKRRVLRSSGNAYEPVDLSLALPRLRPGRYRLCAELRVGEATGDVAVEEITVAAPPRTWGALPLVADGAYHLDRESVERSVGQLAEAGVNTVSAPGPACVAFGERPHREAMLVHTVECAARAGMSLAHYRRGLVPGLSPGAPLSPCPLTPEFRQALEREVLPVLGAAARVPSLRGHELMSRPAVGPEQLCRCAACQAAYRRSLGSDLPSGDPGALDAVQRRALASFVASYWWHALAAVQKTRDEAARDVRLLLTFDALSFVREGAAAPFCDPLVWARACDAAEVAAEADLALSRLSLAGHLATLSALGKPCGAQLDLSDGAVPPAEAAFTALAHGASSLRVAENPRFLTQRRQAPLPEALGGLFRRLARAGPLLACSSRPPARVALLFPLTQAAVSGTGRFLASFELLRAALGEVDILHERLATEDGLSRYAAVALLGADVLPRRVAAALVQFVERGGLLLADRAELRDEDGQALPWTEGFLGAAETPLFEDVTVRRRRFGSGRTVLFSPGIAGAYQQAVEGNDPVAARELRQAVAGTVAEHGVQAKARSAEPQVEVGVRACPDTWLLVAVNHSGQARAARIELDPKAIPALCAYDLLTGEEAPIERLGDTIALTVGIAAHDGGLWVLYPERPFTLRLDVAADAVRRGETLSYTVTVVGEAGRPSRGRHLVRITVRDPSGAERPELGGELLTTQGVLEVSQPLAVNEPPGQWQIRATDPLTRRLAVRAFEVAERVAEAPTGPAAQEPQR